MLELVNMSYNILICLWGTEMHKVERALGQRACPLDGAVLMHFFFFETTQLELASIERLTPPS